MPIRLAALALILALVLPPAVHASDLTLVVPGGGNVGLHVTSYAEIPFKTVIRQQYDYSCGSAAMATLLTYQYGMPVSEADLFKAMYEVGDQASIQKLGFSLLDMKNYLASRGIQADGYRLGLDELAAAATPAIALIQVGSYRHFVVIKGVVDGRVLVGDPSTGLRVYTAAEFTKMWNGIIFMLHTPPGARAVFNSALEWRHWADFHPLQAAMLNRPLEPFLRDLRVIYQIQPNQIMTGSSVP